MYKLLGWTYEDIHVGGLHDGEPFFPQKLGAFNYGMDNLCGGGAWGSSWLEGYFRQLSQQCAYVWTR